MKKNSWDFEGTTALLKEHFGDRIVTERPLADLNTFGTGGNARLFIEISSGDELSRLMKIVSRLEVPVFMLGGGSNVLVSDSGYDGLIIKNSISGLERIDNQIICGAGEELQKLVDFATRNGLSGLEFATGIWGTIGGAIYGNAGAYGGEVGNVLVSAEVVDRKGYIREEKADYFEFAYRWSKLKKTAEFVTRAKIALKECNNEEIKGRVDEIMAMRRAKLPIGLHSAGCFFKNIPDKTQKFGKLSAGKLLEEVGVKKMRCGDARVFENHANILINNGSAHSDDIKKLADLMKSKVRQKFGIELQEEVILLGNFEEERL
ncbi:MAG: UDP-N-acetylmuramate dehydrogenase [Candidatus Zixiibacteriota bacterium]